MSKPNFQQELEDLHNYAKNLGWFRKLFFPTAVYEALSKYDPKSSGKEEARQIFIQYAKSRGIFFWLGKIFLSGLRAFSKSETAQVVVAMQKPEEFNLPTEANESTHEEQPENTSAIDPVISEASQKSAEVEPTASPEPQRSPSPAVAKDKELTDTKIANETSIEKLSNEQLDTYSGDDEEEDEEEEATLDSHQEDPPIFDDEPLLTSINSLTLPYAGETTTTASDEVKPPSEPVETTITASDEVKPLPEPVEITITPSDEVKPLSEPVETTITTSDELERSVEETVTSTAALQQPEKQTSAAPQPLPFPKPITPISSVVNNRNSFHSKAPAANEQTKAPEPKGCCHM